MRSEKGFTLIELLVVILIIAILAAVAIPVFLRQREKGWSAQVQSALKNAATAVESHYTETGSYGDLNSDPNLRQKLAAQGFTIPDWAVADAHDTRTTTFNVKSNASTYCIYAHHVRLPADNPWHQATYQSSVGGPATDPDTCP